MQRQAAGFLQSKCHFAASIGLGGSIVWGLALLVGAGYTSKVASAPAFDALLKRALANLILVPVSTTIETFSPSRTEKQVSIAILDADASSNSLRSLREFHQVDQAKSVIKFLYYIIIFFTQF